MKKFIKIFVVIFSLFAVSCEDQFNQEPISVITSQNMWKTPNDASAGIAGMYSQLRTTLNGDPFMIWFELRSGFWQNGVSGAAQWDDLYLNTPNSSSTPAIDFSNFYKVINAANLAIKYIPDISFSNADTQNDLLADAYFTRAFCYFALARIWGDVPLMVRPVEALDDPGLYPVREDVKVVFDQIKADLEEAATLISDNSARNRIMASQAGINMLKADVYLWTAKRMGGGNADLATAETAASAVVANSNYELLSAYDQVFNIEQNNELIFSIYFAATEGAQNQYGQRFTYQATQVVAAARNNPVPIGSSAQWNTYNDHFVNTYLRKTPGDTRTGVNFQTFTSGKSTYRWVNKYLGEMINGTRSSISDTRIYRYAEAILFKAEAMNALGKKPDALRELNKIAKRAYNVDDFYPTTLTPEEVDAAILHERLIEFAAEGKSWFDIIRFGKAFDLIPTLKGRQNEREGNILLLPIDPSTITNNPKITQTPGF